MKLILPSLVFTNLVYIESYKKKKKKKIFLSIPRL